MFRSALMKQKITMEAFSSNSVSNCVVYVLQCAVFKVIPSGHSSTTWCYMANASMWCLSTRVQKRVVCWISLRNDKESHAFQRQKPLILQHDVDTHVLLTYLSSFSINQHTVLLY